MYNKLKISKEVRKITTLSFVANTILSIIKIYSGIVGKSSAMIADGIHSFSDFLTDIIVIIGIKFTQQPEDSCHNYGHGKYETIATAIISIFLSVVGFNIFKSGITNIIFVINGGSIAKPGYITLIVAFISIISKELLYQYTLIVAKKINSPSMKANAWHHRSDSFSSMGTLIGIGGAILLGNQWTVLDPIASIVVSLLIFKVSFDILLPALSELTESSLNDSEKNKILETIKNCSEIKGFHKLRTRKVGNKSIIEFHILVDENLNIKIAHGISTQLEQELKVFFGYTSIITIHIEPYLK
ncbi:MAG: cation diffusion facilitator family transporter [Clostridiales bacterium]